MTVSFTPERKKDRANGHLSSEQDPHHGRRMGPFFTRKLTGCGIVAHGQAVRPLALVLLSAALLSSACASAPPPEPARAQNQPKVAEETALAPPKRAVPAGHLRREDVLAVLSDGPPVFLQRIDVEPVVDRGGRFHGWRVLGIREAEWADGAIRAGDVITLVNGQSIENPFQFYDVFQALAFAPELRLALERDGTPRELTFPIDEDPSGQRVPRAERSVSDTAPASARPTSQAPAAPEASRPRGRILTTTVIGAQ
jgi:hypothetical protein